MTTIPPNYICSDTCMTGVLQMAPTISDNVFIDARAVGAPKRVEIWLPDGTLVKIFMRENAIHIMRADGSSLDERHIPETKAPR